MHAFLTFLFLSLSCEWHAEFPKPAEILKIEMCKYLGSNFLGAIPPFTNERNRIIEQHYQ